ncbi:hypothetical protein ElyMa_003301000 [Elysia marginata]|uniref:Uncharacterized protein n=1 Tax=Elysia marginata TaxID=1093978 RepID=A0AAV4JFV1_9GAST|nr:hypothetical protein ElyMa_003301000 [Elysia marginata]
MKETSDQEPSSTKVEHDQYYQALETEREWTDLVSSSANSQDSVVVSQDDLRSLLVKSSKKLNYRHENVDNKPTPTPSGENQIESFEVSQDLPNCTPNGQLSHDGCERYKELGFQDLKSEEGSLSIFSEGKQEKIGSKTVAISADHNTLTPITSSWKRSAGMVWTLRMPMHK